MQDQRKARGSIGRRKTALARLRCVGCGYGVVAAIAPERCPMCRSSVWEHAERQPLLVFPTD